jgi:hypothetical protein
MYETDIWKSNDIQNCLVNILGVMLGICCYTLKIYHAEIFINEMIV